MDESGTGRGSGGNVIAALASLIVPGSGNSRKVESFRRSCS